MVDLANHFAGHMNGAMVEFGKSSFSGADLTVEIPCGFSALQGGYVTSMQAPNVREYYSFDSTSAGTTTVRRQVQLRYSSFGLDDNQITSYNFGSMPLLIAQRDMILVEVDWYHGTAFGSGTPSLLLGISGDTDCFLGTTNGLISNPTTNDSATAMTTFDDATIPDGTVLLASTTGGGTSNPADCVITIAYMTPESDLEFSYVLFGRY